MSGRVPLEHEPRVFEYDAIVRWHRHAGKVRPIYGLRRHVECSCGTHLGTALDFIDARRKWAKHTGVAR